MNNAPDYKNNLAFEPDITWEEFVEWAMSYNVAEADENKIRIWLHNVTYVAIDSDKIVWELFEIGGVDFKSFKAIKNVITAIMESVVDN